MKKSLVALAALAVAGVASAQSSVTLFGVVDASISSVSNKSELYVANPLAFVNNPLAFYGLPGSIKSSKTGLNNSAYNSSRIGFRGTEDLGGGLAASFWLESGISNDDGVKGINNFNRRSTVSLSGGFGEVRLGRDFTPTFWNDTVFDPFGTNGVGTNVISSVSGNVSSFAGSSPNGLAGDNYVRTSNSIGYFLPPNLGGFYGQVQYALHENTKQDWIQNSPTKKGRYIGGRFGYANGPLDVAVAYGQDTKDGGPAAGFFTNDGGGWAKNKVNTLNLGASYDFGPVKLFGELSQVKQKVSDDASFFTIGGIPYPYTVGTSDKYNGYLVGVTVPVGAGLIRAAYSRVKAKSGNYGFQTFTLEDLLFGGNNNTSASASKFAIGYVHNLSKRTALYATVARVSLKDAQNSAAIAANTGVSYANPNLAGAVGGFYVPKSSTGYDFGIRHSF